MKEIKVMDNVENVCESMPYREFQSALREREQMAKQMLEEKPEAKHVVYGYRYDDGKGGQIGWLVLNIVTEEMLEQYSKRAATVNGIIYALHKR